MASDESTDLKSTGLKDVDVERQTHDTSYLHNGVVKSLAWSDASVTVPDRQTKKPRRILSDVSGHVAAGKTSLRHN